MVKPGRDGMDLMILLLGAPALLSAFRVDNKGLRDEGIQSCNVDDLLYVSQVRLSKRRVL